MGEMADWQLEQIDADTESVGSPNPNYITCRYCKKEDLVWWHDILYGWLSL